MSLQPDPEELIAYMEDNYPNLLERIKLEVRQKGYFTTNVVKEDNKFFPLRNGFGCSSFGEGGREMILKFETNDRGDIEYILVDESDYGKRTGGRYVFSYKFWFKELFIGSREDWNYYKKIYKNAYQEVVYNDPYRPVPLPKK